MRGSELRIRLRQFRGTETVTPSAKVRWSKVAVRGETVRMKMGQPTTEEHHFILRGKLEGASRRRRRQTERGDRQRDRQPFHGGRDFELFRLLPKMCVCAYYDYGARR